VNPCHDPIIETLVGMGYLRSNVLDALKKCDFDLERVSLRVWTLV